MNMILVQFGLALWAVAAGVAGYLHALCARQVAAFHSASMDRPLLVPAGWAARRHLRRACRSCSLVAELATTHN